MSAPGGTLQGQDPRLLGWSPAALRRMVADMSIAARNSDDHVDHQHTPRCWWNHTRGRWICATETVAGPGGAEGPDPGLVDVRDMIVVHTALLREFRLAPEAVRRVPIDAGARAAVIDRHLGLICDLLHHHHAGEDKLLWPLLRARLPQRAVVHLDEAEAQHASLDKALRRVAITRRDWVQRVDAERRDALVEALGTLHHLLATHLDAEERTLLPLAAAYLTEAEWRAVGAAGAAAIPKTKMPLVFGMFSYEGNPEVLATMLQHAPALPRLLVPILAPRLYAHRAAQVHGTPRP